MATAPGSIARIVWDGLRRKPALTIMSLGVIAAMSVASVGMFTGVAFAGRGEGLPHLAFPLMMSAWLAGFTLFQFAQVMSDPEWQGGASGQHRRGRVRRWLESSKAAFVDLSGATRQRAQIAEAAKESAEAPDAALIAMPVFAALGATCLGFAGAMMLAGFYVAPRSLLLDSPRVYSLFWGGMLVFFLFASLSSVGRASMRVYRWAGQRAAAAARARADMERARLNALQAQMNPHFLFNTLNTVASLAGNSARAEFVVEHLSSVLRHSLQRAGRPFTTVDDEVRFAREYLDVEQARLGARLQVTWNIDADTAPLRVPTMCLLPLIENAIAHAIEPRPEGGRVQISSAMTAGGYLLRLSVDDNGPGFPADMKDGRGIGDLRQRLKAEYGRTCEVNTETLATGARVTISVPATAFDSGTLFAGVETRS